MLVFMLLNYVKLFSAVHLSSQPQTSFQLEVDASASGAGAVLLQDDERGINHPICYFSRKFSVPQMNYSMIERGALSLLLALQYFEVYIGSSPLPVAVYTDHNLLVFLYIMYIMYRQCAN